MMHEEVEDSLAPEQLALPPAPVPPIKVKHKNVGGRKPLPPRDTKLFKSVMAIIALRAQGLTHAAIGEQLGLTKDTINTYLARAHRKGLLKLDDFDLPNDQIDVILRSKVVRNVDVLLDKHDKDATLKVFELLNPAQKQEAPIQPATMVLQVRVDMPPLPALATSATPISIRTGTIGGAIASGIPLDAELIAD